MLFLLLPYSLLNPSVFQHHRLWPHPWSSQNQAAFTTNLKLTQAWICLKLGSGVILGIKPKLQNENSPIQWGVKNFPYTSGYRATRDKFWFLFCFLFDKRLHMKRGMHLLWCLSWRIIQQLISTNCMVKLVCPSSWWVHYTEWCHPIKSVVPPSRYFGCILQIHCAHARCVKWAKFHLFVTDWQNQFICASEFCNCPALPTV